MNKGSLTAAGAVTPEFLLNQLRALALLQPAFDDLIRERLMAVLGPVLHELDIAMNEDDDEVVALVRSWDELAEQILGRRTSALSIRCAWPACGRTDVKLRVCSACKLMR